MTVPGLPIGFGVQFAPDTKYLDEHTLFGGSPARVLRLSSAGVAALAALRDGAVRDRATASLARRLTDAQVAHPCPPAGAETPEVTVIVPVYNRAALLDRCLTGMGSNYRVIVVDDASADGGALAEVAARHGARLVRRAVNGGPGAARNTGLQLVSDGVVAFLDSDCVPDGDWIAQLLPHFADPLVAAVAPRIVALPSGTGAGRFTAAAGSLDLGEQPARVVPGSRVSYVPTAALLVRRAAIDGLVSEHRSEVRARSGAIDGLVSEHRSEVRARSGAIDGIVRPESGLSSQKSTDSGRTMREGMGFDEGMRVGEDVDLIWRLHRAGRRIRYVPTVTVAHHEPTTWPELLTRRFSYGTSAAPLAAKHPEFMAPLVLYPWPALTVAALLARRPGLAAVGYTGAVVGMLRTLRRSQVPPRDTLRAMAGATAQTWQGTGRYSTQFASPLLLLGIVAPGRSGRRLAAASLLFGPALVEWRRRRPPLSPARFVLGRIADDVSYGAGVYAGAVRERSTVALRPRFVFKPLRIARTRS